MKHSHWFSFWLIFLFIFLPINSASAWSNVGEDDRSYGTHAWIADHALHFVFNAENETPTKSRYNWLITYREAFLDGTLAPDRPFIIVSGANPFDYFDQLNHHNYYDSDGNLIEDYASERAQQEYEKALTALDKGEFELAAFYTGAMTHYLADLSNFMHVMGSKSVLGKEPDGYHQDYEKNIRKHTDNLSDDYFSISSSLPQIQTSANAAYEAGRWVGWQAHTNATLMMAEFQSTFRGNYASSEFELRTGHLLNDVINVIADLIFTLGFYSELSDHGEGHGLVFRSVVFLATIGLVGFMMIFVVLIKWKLKRKNR